MGIKLLVWKTRSLYRRESRRLLLKEKEKKKSQIFLSISSPGALFHFKMISKCRQWKKNKISICVFCKPMLRLNKKWRKPMKIPFFWGAIVLLSVFFGSYEPTVLQILNRRYVTGTDKNIEPSDSQNDKMSKMRIDSYEYGYSEIHYIVTINISPYNHAFTSFDFFLLHRYTTHFHLHPYYYVTLYFLFHY